MAEKPFSSLKHYRLLGSSGLRVSPLCYGCMNIQDECMTTDEQSRKCIEEYLQMGGNFFDTANVYEKGKSEIFLGKILAQHRSRSIIATKFTGSKDKSDPNAGGNSRRNMAMSLDASLKRMGLDSVDILYVHFWEFRTPTFEVMRGLDDLIRSGKCHYICVSDAPAWKVSEANTLAELRGFSKFIGLQTQYSLIERTADRDILPMCKELDIGVVNWGPLAQGMLAGKYNHLSVEEAKASKAALANAKNRTEQMKFMKEKGVDTFRPKAVLGDWNERNRKICLTVADVAKECGKSCAQVAINWNLQQPAITSPIIAPRTMEQLHDCCKSLDFTLTKEQLATLDDVSKDPMPSFPQRWGNGDFFTGGKNVERRYFSPDYIPFQF
eukprot:g1868.t1